MQPVIDAITNACQLISGWRLGPDFQKLLWADADEEPVTEAALAVKDGER